MSGAPTPAEIFERAAEEGERRLDQSLLELVSTSFIAGYTIVFGIVALGVVRGLVEPQVGEVARVAGALAFATGLVFLIVGRAELFNENFFDPVAKAADEPGSWMLSPLLRLWTLTFVFNLVGGVLFALIVSVPGVLPSESVEVLRIVAEETVRHGTVTTFVSAIVGGTLITLLSFLLQAVETVRGRITVTYIVGFLLPLGPFDHTIVTALYVFFGILFGAPVGYGALLEIVVVATAGNLVGGLGLGSITHIAQAAGAEDV